MKFIGLIKSALDDVRRIVPVTDTCSDAHTDAIRKLELVIQNASQPDDAADKLCRCPVSHTEPCRFLDGTTCILRCGAHNKHIHHVLSDEIINNLLDGIVAWAADEDGVHPDCYESFRAAAIFVGRFDIVKTDNN